MPHAPLRSWGSLLRAFDVVHKLLMFGIRCWCVLYFLCCFSPGGGGLLVGLKRAVVSGSREDGGSGGCRKMARDSRQTHKSIRLSRVVADALGCCCGCVGPTQEIARSNSFSAVAQGVRFAALGTFFEGISFLLQHGLLRFFRHWSIGPT